MKDIATLAVIGLCILLVLWYGGGYLYNRRRGRQLFDWLEAGWDVLGGEREAGWLGSPASGARVNVVHARPPFRRLEITLLLENRENPFVWLFNRLRGKRDGLIIKATLRAPRRGEIEVIPDRERMKRSLGGDRDWTWRDGPRGLAIAERGPGAGEQSAALVPWLATYGAHLRRFSWRKSDPHIQLQMDVGGLLSISSATFLTSLQSVLLAAMHQRRP